MHIVEIIGLIGATCFAISGVPQLIKSFREGHADGMSYGTIWLWLIGEGAMFTYALIKYTFDFILLGNYFFNFTIVAIIAFYKHFPKRSRMCLTNQSPKISVLALVQPKDHND